MPYIASQFYPRFYTLVPAGILVGLGAAPMWASKATYLTQLGQVYAKLTDQSVEAIIVRFFGFFFLGKRCLDESSKLQQLKQSLKLQLGNRLNFGEI